MAQAAVMMSMPIAGMHNPFTGLPAIGPLAILVDAASGLVNHFRREADEWTVSSELTIELSPEGVDLATHCAIQTHPGPAPPPGAQAGRDAKFGR